ncbi:MAG: leucine-rich repeat domain-containing protein, partial [Allobaculum sp.]|nr:leucine-rich repeat domain-containing protein [Allobaculum sp.]
MFIKNAALADVIAGTLHKKAKDLKEEDLLELIQLDASDLDINTLEGLEYAENLERLNLSNNALTNIKPLKNLQNLVDVNLCGNRLRDIEPLDSHYQLERLNLSRNNLYVMD